ncbi:MAG: Ig-like domain-containing protein [Tenuifilaceae bacterium]|jgi:uncharacterized protein YjdB|nr:Ig-like domain-containing protein [Tenuifilaceae bacterium]
MRTLQILSTMLLLVVANCALAQVTPPTDAPLITLSTHSNATIKIRMQASTANTPVWVETTSGVYTSVTVGTRWTSDQTYTSNSTTIRVYGNITKFDCGGYNNPITALDVSKNTELIGLDCSGNQLTMLDVSKNTKLTALSCNLNQINTLDVSNNIALTALDCNSNQLTTLDVSKNTALKLLYCYNNPFTTAALNGIYCDLPNRVTSDNAVIYPALTSADANHATVLASNAINATTKGWQVKYESNNTNVTTTGNYTCGTVGGVVISPSSIELCTYKATPLTATVLPHNATNKTVAWSSSHPSIATVDNNGVVTGVTGGTTTITATTEEGDFTATCEVKVNVPPTGSPVIIMTVNLNATVILKMQAAVANTPAWVETAPSTYTPITVGTDWTNLSSFTANGNTIKIYGHITKFSSNNNKIKALDVSNNIDLNWLSCDRNDLRTLNISNNTALTELHCPNNRLTTLDISNNTALEKINCSSNQLTELNVSNNTALKLLDCYNNPFTTATINGIYCDLPNRAITDNAVIRPVNIYANDHTAALASNATNATNKGWNVKYFGNNTSITTTGNYTCGSAGGIIVSPSATGLGIGKTIALTATVQPHSTTNKAFTWSSSNTAIATVNNNGIVTGIAEGTATITATTEEGNFTATCHVSISAPPPTETPVITLTVIPNTTIRIQMRANSNATPVWVENTPKAYIPITLNTDYVSQTYTVSGSTIKIHGRISGLICFNNQITALDISKNASLIFLNCMDNQLTALDVSNNHALEKLLCNYNQLTTLDVSNNTALKILNCENNQLTSLDTRNNKALEELLCNNNQITTLDVSKNTTLKLLYCYNNPFTTAALNGIYCDLPNRVTSDNAVIYPALTSADANHATVLASNATNATTKGWQVKYKSNTTDIITTGDYACGTVGDIVISSSSIEMHVGNTTTLTASVQPHNATNKAIIWNTNHPSIATVDGNGVVTGIAEGTTTITATTEEGGFNATCEVTVSVPLTYSVAIATGINNGTLTVSPNANVAQGTVVTVTASPNAGYRLKEGSLKALRSADGSLAFAIADGCFPMPDHDITVTAAFELTTNIDTDETSRIILYPNPAKELVYIKGLIAPSLIEIYNTKGILVLAQTLNPNEHINIGRLSSGIYVVRINKVAIRLVVNN